ncbi:hypothetical protein D3C84_446640 [compost metagenome]
MGQLALAAEHLGAAVEDQLVLAADLIEVNEWQTRLIAALRHQLIADPGLLPVIGGGVDTQQQLGAGRLGRQGRARLPQIFTDEQPQFVLSESHDAGFSACGEVALLVKHPVVGQILLEVTRHQLAPLIEGGRVIERLAFAPGMPHQDGAIALPGSHSGQCSLDPDHQVGPQQQIFRRVTGQCQLGAHQQIGALLIRLCGRSQHLVTVIFDGAYRQI